MNAAVLFHRFYPPAFGALLLLILALAGGQLVRPDVPTLPAAGLGLTALAPLLFLVVARLAPPGERRHPVIVSASIGLGCVMIMVGVQRFGEQYSWLLVPALSALSGWMIYQRRIWRGGRKPTSRP